MTLRPWLDIAIPRTDIADGSFDESLFAADLGSVANGIGPNDYLDPRVFCEKTYLTGNLARRARRARQPAQRRSLKPWRVPSPDRVRGGENPHSPFCISLVPRPGRRFQYRCRPRARRSSAIAHDPKSQCRGPRR